SEGASAYRLPRRCRRREYDSDVQLPDPTAGSVPGLGPKRECWREPFLRKRRCQHVPRGLVCRTPSQYRCEYRPRSCDGALEGRRTLRTRSSGDRPCSRPTPCRPRSVSTPCRLWPVCLRRSLRETSRAETGEELLSHRYTEGRICRRIQAVLRRSKSHYRETRKRAHQYFRCHEAAGSPVFGYQHG